MGNLEVLSVKYSIEMGIHEESKKMKGFKSALMRTDLYSFISIQKIYLKDQINYDIIKSK